MVTARTSKQVTAHHIAAEGEFQMRGWTLCCFRSAGEVFVTSHNLMSWKNFALLNFRSAPSELWPVKLRAGERILRRDRELYMFKELSKHPFSTFQWSRQVPIPFYKRRLHKVTSRLPTEPRRETQVFLSQHLPTSFFQPAKSQH